MPEARESRTLRGGSLGLYRASLVVLSIFGCTAGATRPAPGESSVAVTTGIGGAATTGAGGAVGQGGAATTSSASTTVTTSAGGGEGGGGGESEPPDASMGCRAASDCDALDETCQEGACIDGVCTAVPASEAGACEDGLLCTKNDACQGGVCVPGSPPFCPPVDKCHIGVCDEATGLCKTLPGNDGAQCDDLDPCTNTGFCGGGECLMGFSVDCSDYDGPCNVGVCSQDLLCHAEPSNEGLPCNDATYCTVHDRCTQGVCGGDPNTCILPTETCKVAGCAVPGGLAVPCSDGNDCTTGEACLLGVCENGLPANDGSPCNDHNGCTAGTTCSSGHCKDAVSIISDCVDGDGCCPLGCPDDKDCNYYPSGVKEDLAVAALKGWTQCYAGTYADAPVPLATILAQCDKPKLLLGCRHTGSATLTLAAAAPRADVLFDCGSQPSCTKQSNNVGWYYSPSFSWGFAMGTASVNRSPCDIDEGNSICPSRRMCWVTTGGALDTGFRCGETIVSDASWERVIFHAD